MDKSLIPNEIYSLSTKEEVNQNKEFFFVKLTDSSLRAVEEYIENKAAIKGQPKIKFFGQDGILHLPSRPGSASQDIGKKFKFSCSYFARDGRQGITDCIRQSSKERKALESLGMIEKKIAVMATDEAYEMTRNRMAQADQERKGVRTKEININHPKTKKKKTIIAPVGKEMNAAVKKKLGTNSSSIKPINGLKPTPAIGSSAPVKGLSYKDRVIHILALRPHKKLEIFARLQREGINQKDKNSLGAVLQQVATMQDNCFKLNKHFYADVKPDTWPYYSDAEKLAVKENLSQFLSQESSPKVSSTSKSPEEKGVKRHLNEEYNVLNSKKPRIAKPIQDPATSSSVVSKGSTTNQDTHLNKKSTETQITPLNKVQPLTNKSELSKNRMSNHMLENSEQKLRLDKKTERISPLSSLKFEKQDRMPVIKNEDSPPTVASTSDIPEHILKYQPIKSYDQRCKYKQDFQAQYREYIELKENVDKVSRKFLELDRIRRKYPDDSEAAQKIKQEIFFQYEEHQKDKKFREMKQRYAELYAKLSHIKKLVVEFDQKHLQSVSS